MPVPVSPQSGQTYVAHGYEWVWVAPQESERGHWLATDETRVKIVPASDGVATLNVCVPYGPTSEIEDMIVHLKAHDFDGAFKYGAEERRARAN